MQTFSSKASVEINAAVEVVWDGLTKPELVKQYFFGTNLVPDWKVGGEVNFSGEWEGKKYEDKGTVLSFDPPRSLSYNFWSDMSGEVDVLEKRIVIKYTVEPVGENVSKVTIDQSNTDTQEKADHSAKNWLMVLEALKKLLEGKSK